MTMLVAPGATIAERLNNSIVMLQRAAAASTTATPGVKRSIKALHDHWQLFWAQNTTSMPLSKLRSYAAWYTRGWLLLIGTDRDKAPDPRALDVSLSAVVQDTIAAMSEGAQAVARGTSDGATFIANEAAKMGEEIAKSADALAAKATSAFRELATVAVILGGLYVASKFLDTKKG